MVFWTELRIVTMVFSNIHLRLPTEDEMLPCLSKQLLDMECPGCGLQRAVVLMLQGEFKASFLMYPGLYPLILLFALIVFDRIFNLSFGQRGIALLGLLTVGTILTNFIIRLML